MNENKHSRRQVMGAAALAGTGAVVGAAGLAGCSSGDDDGGSDKAASSSASSSSGAKAIATTSEVPVDGGKIIKDDKVVVTQPEKGTYKGFTAVCPHKGCLVGSVSNGVIVCPCHDSEFSAADGSVKKGPATKGLSAVDIKVSGDQIALG